MSNSLNLHLMNPEQYQATTHINGPLLILAGAGSGKTRVITHRIGYLIEKGISARHILAVSFTNKAATEMVERVAHLIGPDAAKKVYMSTFHSLGFDILRQDIDVLGFQKPFTILDTGDQLRIVRDLLDENNINTKVIDPKYMLFLISRAKMAFCEPQQMPEFKYKPETRFAQKIFSGYQSALKGRNAVDFDDLICLPVAIFNQSEKVRQRWANRFKYVMIDEYQDTNHTQLMFVHELIKDHHNICVVGDDDQSIYGFRGAVADNILGFEHQYPNTKLIMLEQNYRSTNTILNVANKVIGHNTVRKDKELWSAKGDGHPMNLVYCADEREEVEFVAGEIERWKIETNWRYSDFCILYRVNPQARLFEEALRALRIPYEVIGSKEFFDRSEVKDCVAFLRSCLNLSDENSVRRIVNVPPRGIGPVLMERISDFALVNQMTYFDALRYVADNPGTIEGIGFGLTQKIKDFVSIISEFHGKFKEIEQTQQGSLPEQARALVKRLRFIEHIRDSEKNPKIAKRRVENVENLLSDIAEFATRHGGSLDRYLMRITLDRSTQKDDEEKDAVKLMTFHSSKGLEFLGVFMVGMEDGYLPHQNSLDRPSDIAEERRLCYVGITRAKERLCLTCASQRTKFGKKESRDPSRFLAEIPKDMIQSQNANQTASVVEQQEARNEKYLDLARKLFDY